MTAYQLSIIAQYNTVRQGWDREKVMAAQCLDCGAAINGCTHFVRSSHTPVIAKQLLEVYFLSNSFVKQQENISPKHARLTCNHIINKPQSLLWLGHAVHAHHNIVIQNTV